jgi:thymidylate synthase
MAVIDKNYHNLLEKILQEGYTYEDPNRKGVNRLEIPSYTFRHEFKDGFPAITTKKLNYKSVVTELLWFLKGSTNIKYLVDNGCNIWNKDAYNYFKSYLSDDWYPLTALTIEQFVKAIKNNETKYNFENYKLGDLGPVYGHQWRKWSTNKTTVIGHNGTHNIFGEIVVDQIQRLIKNLKEKPLATDHIVNSWNVGDLENMALPPCHYGFQIVVRPLFISDFKKLGVTSVDLKNIPKYGFELHWSQRSCDVFLGIPFNIASYATLALILEKNNRLVFQNRYHLLSIKNQKQTTNRKSH